MTFIEHNIEKIDRSELVDIASCAFVRCYDNVNLPFISSKYTITVLRKQSTFNIIIAKELLDFFMPLKGQGIRTYN